MLEKMTQLACQFFKINVLMSLGIIGFILPCGAIPDMAVFISSKVKLNKMQKVRTPQIVGTLDEKNRLVIRLFILDDDKKISTSVVSKAADLKP